eukprot:CAMPEP_0195049214 /NCGR_PEP_ID=MMETSP0347-20130606/54540_1 /TAXON_ID=2932 /ORGANISM="Alexandrium fundyense, Strain CCMP1719" /LENGTH=56 /DNA_ID=CAMNT_0040077885 /DNA_START=69 /DNA_END=235 /DNA_ORIENTATION=+
MKGGRGLQPASGSEASGPVNRKGGKRHLCNSHELVVMAPLPFDAARPRAIKVSGGL